MSSSLNAFLHKLKGSISPPLKPIHVVLGNESLDLDSAVCSLVYAHAYSSSGILSSSPQSSSTTSTIPILNVKREDFSLKTEVMYSLKASGIDPSLLICRDEFDFTNTVVSGVSLMDHHVLSKELGFLRDRVHTVFDHRPLSTAESLVGIELTHALVGSCASLVASKLLESGYKDPIGLKLLYSAILTDTLSLKAPVTSSVDVNSLEGLEKILGLTPDARSTELDSILKAKGDIASLSISQLLRKDLKVIMGVSSRDQQSPKVSLSSLMVSIQSLHESREKHFLPGLMDYLKNSDSLFGVLTGMVVEDGGLIRRDMIVYSLEQKVITPFKAFLLGLEDLELSVLEEGDNNTATGLAYVRFKIGNGCISRKKLLPFVQEYINTLSF